MKKPTGFIVYRGASLLNGEPIVVVAITAKSANKKTGDVVQTYILVDNTVSPVENVKSLADSAICGDCPHRCGLGGACYVNLGKGPRAVADGVVRGIYPNDIDAAIIAASGRIFRLGTYGDPAAVPAEVWEKLLSLSSGHLGYTHQWKSGAAEHVKNWCMASADSISDREHAQSLNWRTFRVRANIDDLGSGEFVCPASSEAGYRKICATCGACNGGVNARKGSPAIIVHGYLKNRFKIGVSI